MTSATPFIDLHKADVPVNDVEVSTAPTASSPQGMKDLQIEEIFDGRCAVDVYKLRSINSFARAIAECSIDRRKYLQIDVSMGMQSMRAILCGISSHQRCGRGNAQTFSYGGVIQDEALSDCGLSLVQASFIYVLMPGLAG